MTFPCSASLLPRLCAGAPRDNIWKVYVIYGRLLSRISTGVLIKFPSHSPRPMDSPYQLQPIDGLSGLFPESWSPVLGVEPRPSALLSNLSPQSFYTASDLRPSNFSSPQSNSYYSAISSPCSITTTTSSTLSSTMSFPYSVTSINSRKSRMNVLYPRRAHPLPRPAQIPAPPPSPHQRLAPYLAPVPLPPENMPISHGVRFFSSCFL